MAGRLLSLIAVLGATGKAVLPVNHSIIGLHAAAEYPVNVRVGWNLVVTHFDTALGVSGLPVPNWYDTTVYMDDGTPLFTQLLIPYPTDQRRPAVFCRSPYGPLSRSLAMLYTGLGFVAVMQDDRGTFSSGGTFNMFRRASADGATTIDWVVRQPWSNGEVYTVGISADGMAELALILAEPPNLKGQWWAWTTGNGHDFVYPHGVYRQDLLEHYMDFMSLFTHGVSKKQVIPALRANEAWSSRWWYNLTDCRDPSPCHYSKVKFPVISTAGWWDIFSQTQIDDWNGIREHSDPSVRDKHVLIVGPLGHCLMDASGPVNHAPLVKGEAASFDTSARLAGEFFSGKFSGPVRSRLGRINLFVMGEFDEYFQKNWWTSLDDWPPFTTSTFYLQEGNSLVATPPQKYASAAYEYDPKKPTPMRGGANIPGVSHTLGCGSVEQLSRESRDDVLVFDSEILSQDMPVVGRLSARLFVSSSRNDTDFVVTLSDVTPGYFASSVGKKSMLVRYGAQRMRWRDNDSVMSAPMVPNYVYEIVVDLMTVAYIFPKGHQIRVAVSSAAAPFYNPNYNTGRSEVTDSFQEPVVATNEVHFSPKYPSSVSLPVVSLNDIPPNKLFGTTSALDASRPIPETSDTVLV